MPDDMGFLDEDLIAELQQPAIHFTEGERREVAILFADVKGFTSMSARLDPEEVHRKMDEIMRLFSKCVSFYGGYVDKYEGDLIMALFGAKSASEQDTERAILAALKMIQQLRLYNSLLAQQPQFKDVQLGIRVGINTGLVSVGKVGERREGDFTVYGTPVNLASRMESNAPVNRIMMSLETKRVVEHLFEFERMGMVQAKGFDEPVDCYLVVAPKTDKTYRWTRRRSIYVGRENEQNLLRARLAELAQPEATTTLLLGIQGDAGLGKSRLVHEFLQETGQKAVLLQGVASGVCSAPYNIFSSLLEALFRVHVNEPLPEKRRKLDEGIAALGESLDESKKTALEDIKPLLGHLLEIRSNDSRLKQSGEDLLGHIRQAVAAVLRLMGDKARAQGKPAILLLDDLHWMDSASAAVLDFLVQTLFRPAEADAPSWLVLLLYRPDYTPPASIVNHPAFTGIALQPLSEPEIARLIHQHTQGMTLPPETVERVKTLSVGNPFYLEEWCQYIQDLPREELKDFPVPANLHAMVLSRLDRLSDVVKLLLQKASVVGQEFFVEILSEIERRLQSPGDVSQTLGQLEEQTIILKMLGFDYSAYFFKHITTREVAYQTLLRVNRKLLHHLTAEAIETLFPDQQEAFLFALADHYCRAEITDKARFYLSKAADAARRAYSNTQAIALYSRLMGLIPQEEQAARADCLLKIADIKWQTGDWDEAELDTRQALQWAEEAGDPYTRYEAHRQIGIHAFVRGQEPKALAGFDAAHAIAEEINDDALHALIHGNYGVWHQSQKDLEKALWHHNRAIELAEPLGDSLTIAKARNNIGLILMSQGQYSEAEAAFREALRLAEDKRYQKIESIALGNIGWSLQKQGREDEAMPWHERKWLLADKMHDVLELVKVLGNIGNIHRNRGEYREALDFYRRILSLRETLGNARDIANNHYNIALMLAALDQHEAALAEYDKAIEIGLDFTELLVYYLLDKAVSLCKIKSKETMGILAEAASRAAATGNAKLIDLCREYREEIGKIHSEEK